MRRKGAIRGLRSPRLVGMAVIFRVDPYIITHVAIIHGGVTYVLPEPYRHHHIIHQIYLETGAPVDGEVQGFLDGEGNFLNREEAFVHARACGQVAKDSRDDGWLYSEDLW